jgi:hypothetical protein
MNLKDDLAGLSSEIHARIREATQKNETESVIANARILEELEDIRRLFSSLESRYQNLKVRFGHPTGNQLSLSAEEKTVRVISAKAQGMKRREGFLKIALQRGIELTQIKGVQYRSRDNKLVGIASAVEDKRGRWFLGLAPADYDTFVLLCEDKNKRVITIISTVSFAKDVLPRLSTDITGQIKFNVKRFNDRFFLTIPNEREQSLDGMIDNYENL